MKKIKVLIPLLFIVSACAFGQNFYDLNTIQTIRITFAQSNWDALLDAQKAGADGYTMATSVEINGILFDSVGVKYKGNSSYNANQVKNPFHIELDTYKNHDYQGFTDIKLSNVAYDPTFVREALAFKILGNYMDAPLANYAKVYVNGNLLGLYTNVESISKKFVDSRFGSKSNSFFDCSPPAGAGPQTTNLPNLAYLGTDSAAYYSAYDMKSNAGWNDLVNLTNVLSNNTTNIESVLDVDRTLWMLAFHNAFVNLDSYIGQFKQNYYLYEADNGQFNPVIWDLNMCFGVFGMSGSGGNLTTATKRTLSPTLHATESNWPLVVKLLAVPSYKKRYFAHYKTILTEFISNGRYLTDAQAIQTLISAAVTSDVNKFSYQSNITTNLTTDVQAGNNSAPGLSSLMSARSTYLAALADFTNTQPAISSVAPSNTSPQINSSVAITATVTNTTSTAVYLGYRFSQNAIFTKVLMYDDGVHNDGAANDNKYGVSVTLRDAAMQYYIVAENANTAKFSPERAEHEFYTLNAALSATNVVINELMASNSTTVADNNNQYDDWIELHNKSTAAVNVGGWYISDNAANRKKWQIPAGTTIPASGYLIIWADEDSSQNTTTHLHANFKLSASGETVLLSGSDTAILDQVTYGQLITDKTYGRKPNGTGDFFVLSPTFNANNNTATTNTVDILADNDLKIFPNPANTEGVTVQLNVDKDFDLRVYNALGQMIFANKITNELHVDTQNWQAGMYVFKVGNIHKKVIVR